MCRSLSLSVLAVVMFAMGAMADPCSNPHYPYQCWSASCPSVCYGCRLASNNVPVPQCEPDSGSTNIPYANSTPTILSQGAIAGICIGSVLFCCCLYAVLHIYGRGPWRWWREVRAGNGATLQRTTPATRLHAMMARSNAQRVKRPVKQRGKSRPVVSSAVQLSIAAPASSLQPASQLLVCVLQQQQQHVYSYAAQPVQYIAAVPSQPTQQLPPSYAEAAADNTPPPPYVESQQTYADAYQPRDTLPIPEGQLRIPQCVQSCIRSAP